MSIYGDLVKLASNNGGRIPAPIPAHFVQWASNERRVDRGRPSRPALKVPPPAIICAAAAR